MKRILLLMVMVGSVMNAQEKDKVQGKSLFSKKFDDSKRFLAHKLSEPKIKTFLKFGSGASVCAKSILVLSDSNISSTREMIRGLVLGRAETNDLQFNGDIFSVDLSRLERVKLGSVMLLSLLSGGYTLYQAYVFGNLRAQEREKEKAGTSL